MLCVFPLNMHVCPTWAFWGLKRPRVSMAPDQPLEVFRGPKSTDSMRISASMWIRVGPWGPVWISASWAKRTAADTEGQPVHKINNSCRSLVPTPVHLPCLWFLHQSTYQVHLHLWSHLPRWTECLKHQVRMRSVDGKKKIMPCELLFGFSGHLKLNAQCFAILIRYHLQRQKAERIATFKNRKMGLSVLHASSSNPYPLHFKIWGIGGKVKKAGTWGSHLSCPHGWSRHCQFFFLHRNMSEQFSSQPFSSSQTAKQSNICSPFSAGTNCPPFLVSQNSRCWERPRTSFFQKDALPSAGVRERINKPTKAKFCFPGRPLQPSRFICF